MARSPAPGQMGFKEGGRRWGEEGSSGGHFPQKVASPLWMIPAEWQWSSPSTICLKMSFSALHRDSKEPLRPSETEESEGLDPEGPGIVSPGSVPSGKEGIGVGEDARGALEVGSILCSRFFSHTSSVTPGTGSIEMYRMYGHFTTVPLVARTISREEDGPAAAAASPAGGIGGLPRL